MGEEVTAGGELAAGDIVLPPRAAGAQEILRTLLRKNGFSESVSSQTASGFRCRGGIGGYDELEFDHGGA